MNCSTVSPSSSSVGPRVVADERLGEQVETGRDRGVGGEESPGAGGLPGLEEREALGLHEVAHALQAGEDGVPLVEMAHLGLGPKSPQRPGAADAEHQLLGQPFLGPSAVEFVGDPLGGRVVLGHERCRAGRAGSGPPAPSTPAPTPSRPAMSSETLSGVPGPVAGRHACRDAARHVSPAMTGLMGSVPKSCARYLSRCQPLSSRYWTK